jgi:fucose permease
MVILAGVFKSQSLDSTLIPFRDITLMWAANSLIKTVCLQEAGEILPDKISFEEIRENKFRQLMKNKNVHLFAVFLMVYTVIEITIGGITRSLRLFKKNG